MNQTNTFDASINQNIKQTQDGEFQEALQQQQQDNNEPKPERPDANPYRSLGDAKKEWQKRLNVQDKKEKDKSTEQQVYSSLHETMSFIDPHIFRWRKRHPTLRKIKSSSSLTMRRRKRTPKLLYAPY